MFFQFPLIFLSADNEHNEFADNYDDVYRQPKKHEQHCDEHNNWQPTFFNLRVIAQIFDPTKTDVNSHTKIKEDNYTTN